jgi:hypothetical protein
MKTATHWSNSFTLLKYLTPSSLLLQFFCILLFCARTSLYWLLHSCLQQLHEFYQTIKSHFLLHYTCFVTNNAHNDLEYQHDAFDCSRCYEIFTSATADLGTIIICIVDLNSDTGRNSWDNKVYRASSSDVFSATYLGKCGKKKSWESPQNHLQRHPRGPWCSESFYWTLSSLRRTAVHWVARTIQFGNITAMGLRALHSSGDQYVTIMLTYLRLWDFRVR